MVVVIGLVHHFSFDFRYPGAGLRVASGFSPALFLCFQCHVREAYPSYVITFYEMTGHLPVRLCSSPFTKHLGGRPSTATHADCHRLGVYRDFIAGLFRVCLFGLHQVAEKGFPVFLSSFR